MHIPVLLDKVLEYLNPKPGENFIDCTIGIGGHAKAILERTTPNGKLLGIDIDPASLKRIEPRERLILAHGNFKELKEIIKENNFLAVNGILFDLGLSNWQIEESGKGFTYKKDEPLIMILNGKQEVTAEEIINSWPEESLVEIFKNYAEEKYSRKIVTEIVKQRKLAPIKTTFQLKNIIKKVIPFSLTRRGTLSRVLARIFQALRIVINDELENLKSGLEQSMDILAPEGKIVVISFHSLEDRIVKNFFKEQQTQGRLKILTDKPVIADEIEISMNYRSRSAKLRAAIKI
ncbi:MAG: 16S rRNA (cytosine(1402)-N(4))-methyltransferase [Candidatus Portnoybacteria bacterium CG10_big_fil_rev_8_21_14_0_10_38_18]|uniref:Ribosomal RNA small subunit methyltransferase H n=1 Tax=Candidatus Portnoybacteria bacterium CG10_big_fil_rev_8_21_14_0_10_38_18 TaxID=1974813 RepID=A0A2M8KCZ1_9BACT|nr:MAG: 16S rRNA (cytosine(1402)-N(4))-methyltransferase [Candidatus Portnoybacteria bacterium CG10_big_fil_rev_8_21_14_0_10_38_18]